MRRGLRNYFIDLARAYLHRNGWLTVSPFFRGVVLSDCVAAVWRAPDGSVQLDISCPPHPTIITMGATVLDNQECV